MEAPEGGLCRGDIDGPQFLEHVLHVQKHWVEASLASRTYNPDLLHNVSNAVTVKEDEWAEVGDLIWENRQHFTGVALLADTGDKTYRQAPREAVENPEDVLRWNRIEFTPVDYRQLSESEDRTKLADVAACAGGACEL